MKNALVFLQSPSPWSTSGVEILRCSLSLSCGPRAMKAGTQDMSAGLPALTFLT